MNETGFRSALPAFWDTALFPSASVVFWLAFSVQQVNPSKWTTLTDMGVALLTAHNLILEQREGGAGQTLQPGGTTPGVLTSKAVGSVSAGYDVNVASFVRGGDLNLTTYGVRFLRLSRQMGAGPIQVGSTLAPGMVTAGPTVQMPLIAFG